MTQTGHSKRKGARPPRLTPKKRDRVDTSLVALCYWLIAQRLVEDAEAHGELDCPDESVHPERQLGDTDEHSDPALDRTVETAARRERESGGRS